MEYLEINLIDKYSSQGITEEIETAFNLYKDKFKNLGFKYEHEELKVGDTIEFIAGYNLDIIYTTKILGFDKEGDIYLLWDCYWSPIRLNDPNRKIKKVTV